LNEFKIHVLYFNIFVFLKIFLHILICHLYSILYGKMHPYLINMAWLWLDTIKLNWYTIMLGMHSKDITCYVQCDTIPVYRASVGKHARFFS